MALKSESKVLDSILTFTCVDKDDEALTFSKDVDLSLLAWIVSFLIGFITFGLVGGIIGIVIVAIVEGIAEKIGFGRGAVCFAVGITAMVICQGLLEFARSKTGEQAVGPEPAAAKPAPAPAPAVATVSVKRS